MTNSHALRFEDTVIAVHDVEGNRWVTAKETSAALGYDDSRAFRKLVGEMADRNELSEGRHFKFLPLDGPGGTQETLVLSRRGVIRTCMRSDAPRAIAFRDWAEEVLDEVMRTGRYDGRESVNPRHTCPHCDPDRLHWTDLLTPAQRLELSKTRAKILMKIADKPQSRALWVAYRDTWGGRNGWVDFARKQGLPIPTSREGWAHLEAEDLGYSPLDEPLN